MKIAISDSCGLKFSQDIMDHWIAKGHEVRYERGASEFLAQWADIYYIDWVDNNINYLFDIYKGKHEEHPNWQTYKRPKFVVRAIDYDIWCGGAKNQDLIDFVDTWICIAPHMEKKLREDADFGDKLHLIRPGVNLEKFTLKSKVTDGFQLGMVLGDFWPQAKNHMGGLDIFTTLFRQDNRWRLHIRGQHEVGEYWPIMYDHYLESRGIKDVVTLYGQQQDMNQWYENISILLHPGMKEAFCYAVGESLSKGICVIFNDFYGSKDIWSNNLFDICSYKTHEEAVEKISAMRKYPINSESNRKYIEDNYSLERMLRDYDELLGL